MLYGIHGGRLRRRVSVSALFDGARITEIDGRVRGDSVAAVGAVAACVCRVGSLQDDGFHDGDERRTG